MRRLLIMTLTIALAVALVAAPAVATSDKPGRAEPTITIFPDSGEPHTEYVDYLGVCIFETWRVTANRPGTLTYWAYENVTNDLLATGEVSRLGNMSYEFRCDGPGEVEIRHYVELTHKKKGTVIATAEDVRVFSFSEFSPS